MMTRDIDYAFAEISLRGFLAHEGSGDEKRPGVLVIHDAGGLGDNVKEKTRRLASLGYVAFALDLFGGGSPVTDGLQRIYAIASNLERWRGLATAGLSVLASQPEVDASRLAAIGYCFGGTTAYELARTGADLEAVVGFHSGLAPSSGDASRIKAKVLALLGADDPLILPEAGSRSKKRCAKPASIGR